METPLSLHSYRHTESISHRTIPCPWAVAVIHIRKTLQDPRPPETTDLLVEDTTTAPRPRTTTICNNIPPKQTFIDIPIQGDNIYTRQHSM